MELTQVKNFLANNRQQKNILILMHLTDCPWCHFVIEEILQPMSTLKEYDKIKIYQLDADSDFEFINFDNKKISTNNFLSIYNIDFYPTLLLFNYKGKLLEKVVGVASKDFYWTELDNILEKYEN